MKALYEGIFSDREGERVRKVHVMRNQKWLACCMSIEIVEIDNIEMWRVEKDRQQTTDNRQNRQAQELRNQITHHSSQLTDLAL
jgi:hypothetical protein